ncbi:MAG: glycerol-3-phosphate dehydrogenase/oxidase [Ferruginibacter sp.]
MNRAGMICQLQEDKEWDIVIIGGGATGLGIAVDATTRGYSTLLIEQHDFAKGTSGRSTKLVHGGVRYLAQRNIKLVREALKERGRLLQNAPHVTTNLSFVLPCYSRWQKIYYGIGLLLYDLMSGRHGLGKTKIISSKKAAAYLPTINTKKLSGAIVYRDGQFDDTRLAINLAQTAAENSATIINYCALTQLIKTDGKITGAVIHDNINNIQYQLRAKQVINATGVFTDEILKLDDANAENMVSPSQGIHLVLDTQFFPGPEAMMIPKTEDGRVLFAVPWHDKVVVGTTDTPVATHSLEPIPLEQEIEFVLHHINKYLDVQIKRTDVKSVFAGLRPLVKQGASGKTALMPRDHTILVSAAGLVSITGGKWTTYRKMAADTLNTVVKMGKLNKTPCITEHLKIHGWTNAINNNDPLHFYGSDAILIKALCNENTTWAETIHPSFPYIKAIIIWAIRNEMALTIEDILARRIRLLFLDARAAIESAPVVAAVMAKEMGKDALWQQQQITTFTTLAKQYLLS